MVHGSLVRSNHPCPAGLEPDLSRHMQVIVHRCAAAYDLRVLHFLAVG